MRLTAHKRIAHSLLSRDQLWLDWRWSGNLHYRQRTCWCLLRCLAQMHHIGNQKMEKSDEARLEPFKMWCWRRGMRTSMVVRRWNECVKQIPGADSRQEFICFRKSRKNNLGCCGRCFDLNLEEVSLLNGKNSFLRGQNKYGPNVSEPFNDELREGVLFRGRLILSLWGRRNSNGSGVRSRKKSSIWRSAIPSSAFWGRAEKRKNSLKHFLSLTLGSWKLAWGTQWAKLHLVKERNQKVLIHSH